MSTVPTTVTTVPPAARAAVPLVVDRVACTGHGVCAAVLPDHVELDEWGYPVLLGPGAAPAADPALVAAAVRLCPARALVRWPATTGRAS